MTEAVEEFTRAWLGEKRRARTYGTWDAYRDFLKLVQKQFLRLYTQSTHAGWQQLYQFVLEIVACEIKESIIESGLFRMADPKKPVVELTNEELVTAYKTGEQWLLNHQQVSDTTLTTMGELYNDALWQRALKRLEHLADEMKRRGLAE